jgi:hypothetical protein
VQGSCSALECLAIIHCGLDKFWQFSIVFGCLNAGLEHCLRLHREHRGAAAACAFKIAVKSLALRLWRLCGDAGLVIRLGTGYLERKRELFLGQKKCFIFRGFCHICATPLFTQLLTTTGMLLLS